jgi:chromosome segregation ATPase
MSETNGAGKSRLDRIEEMIERNEALNERRMLANDAAHEKFEAEHRQLLAAQILMNGAMQNTNVAMLNMNGVIQEMTEGLVSLEKKVQEMAAGMISLELKMEETTGNLNALIDTVDGIIRRDQPPQR